MPSPIEFRHSICRAVPVMKNLLHQLLHPILQKHGLTLAQFFVLSAVRSGTAGTVGALSREIGIGQANTSTLCKKMEQDGLLLRTKGKEDERIVNLSLTSKAKSILTAVESLFSSYDAAQAKVPEDQLEVILNGMRCSVKLLEYMVNNQSVEESQHA